MKTITIEECAKTLLEKDNIIILMHKSPDGDAVGCGYALSTALRKLGKKAVPICSDPIPKKYGYITDVFENQGEFEPEYIVTVDLADTNLFGDKLIKYRECADMCIDHHGSNTGYAKEGVVDPSAGACTQIVKKVIDAMGVEIDRQIANAVFTGIVTDTGCFKYSNASVESYLIAAEMIEHGAENVMINRIMFDTKSRQRVELERLALESLKFYEEGKIAAVFITKGMFEETGALDSDTEGISGMPRQIEGVQAGITIKEKDSGVYKISVRTSDGIDACEICKKFGGGGHKAAAGCTIEGTLEFTEKSIVEAAREVING